MEDDEVFDYLIGKSYEIVMPPDLWQEATELCWRTAPAQNLTFIYAPILLLLNE